METKLFCRSPCQQHEHYSSSIDFDVSFESVRSVALKPSSVAPDGEEMNALGVSLRRLTLDQATGVPKLLVGFCHQLEMLESCMSSGVLRRSDPALKLVDFLTTLSSPLLRASDYLSDECSPLLANGAGRARRDSRLLSEDCDDGTIGNRSEEYFLRFLDKLVDLEMLELLFLAACQRNSLKEAIGFNLRNSQPPCSSFPHNNNNNGTSHYCCGDSDHLMNERLSTSAAAAGQNSVASSIMLKLQQLLHKRNCPPTTTSSGGFAASNGGLRSAFLSRETDKKDYRPGNSGTTKGKVDDSFTVEMETNHLTAAASSQPQCRKPTTLAATLEPLPVITSSTAAVSDTGSVRKPVTLRFLTTPTKDSVASSFTTSPAKRSSGAKPTMEPLRIEIPPLGDFAGIQNGSGDQFKPIPNAVMIGSEKDNEFTVVSPIAKEFRADCRDLFSAPTPPPSSGVSDSSSSIAAGLRITVSLSEEDDVTGGDDAINGDDLLDREDDKDKENDPEVAALCDPSSGAEGVFCMSPPPFDLQNNNAASNGSSTCSGATNGKRTPTPQQQHYIPHIDFKALHEHYENSEPVRWHFSPIGRSYSEDAAAAKFDGDEAETDEEKWRPQSARAVNYHGAVAVKRKFVCVETPPNATGFQLAHEPIQPQTRYENQDEVKLRKLERKLRNARRKLTILEEEFMLSHEGRKPSEYDRLQSEGLRKYGSEVASIKRELKAIKLAESKAIAKPTSYLSPDSPSLCELKQSRGRLTLAQTVEIAWRIIGEQREEQGKRSSSLAEMSNAQLRQEKLTVQKVLLHLESAHGRPVAPDEREIVRPLYDWYRQVKRTLFRFGSPRGSLCELKTIIEGEYMHFHDPEETPNDVQPNAEMQQRSLSSGNGLLDSPIRTFITRARASKANRTLQTLDGVVQLRAAAAPTRLDTPAKKSGASSNGQMSLDLDSVSEPEDEEEIGNDAEVASRMLDEADAADEDGSQTCRELATFYEDETGDVYTTLHRMPPEQLYKVRRTLADRKKTLRKLINFDDAPSSAIELGFRAALSTVPSRRKITSALATSEKAPILLEYKRVKAKLKLVEALLSKHRASC